MKRRIKKWVCRLACALVESSLWSIDVKPPIFFCSSAVNLTFMNPPRGLCIYRCDFRGYSSMICLSFRTGTKFYPVSALQIQAACLKYVCAGAVYAVRKLALEKHPEGCSVFMFLSIMYHLYSCCILQ